MSRNSIRQFVGLLVAIFAILTMMQGRLLVQAQDDASASKVEIIGEITALNVDSITINDLLIDVTNAEINTALELGKVVKVEGFIAADGSIIARQVNDLDDDDRLPGEAEFIGLLSAFSAGSMTVAGIEFDVSGAEIGASVEVGKWVKVHATFSANSVWVAREVKRVDDDDLAIWWQSDDEIEMIGTLEALDDDSITVSGRVISIVGAEIKDNLVVGALVKVHASLVNDEWVAREVELFKDDDDDDDLAIPDDCVPAQPNGWTTYTIRAGDTLSEIAERTGTTTGKLALANCIRDTRMIIVGVSIFVPREPVPVSNDNDDNSNDNDDDDDNGNSNSNDNDDDNGNGNSNDNDDNNNNNNSNDNDDDDDDDD